MLRRGNGRENKRNRRTPNFSLKNRHNNDNRYAPVAHNNYKKQKKRSRKTVLLVISAMRAQSSIQGNIRWLCRVVRRARVSM